MPKLTKRFIDSLEPDPGAEILAWDDELKGFGVRVMPSGVASFIIKFRNSEGRQRKLALGRVGVLTPDQARDEARTKLGEIVKGADPSAARKQIRKSITVSELCDLYTEHAEGRVKASTLAMDKSRIERHVKRLIGNKTVMSLTAVDVSRLQRDIVAGKTKQPRAKKGRGGVTTGGKGVASRTVGMLGTILEFARKQGIVKENVARSVDRAPDGKQRRFLTVPEIETLGKALNEALRKGESETAVGAIRFLLASGCRRMEALALPLKWIDVTGGCIRFEDTKSGYQVRPIGQSAFKFIPKAPEEQGWAFPAARGEGHFVGLPKVLKRICDSAGLEGVTVHVLRHSFAATAAGLGYSELTIAGLLGHTVPGVTARYAHVADSALVSAANSVSALIYEKLNPDVIAAEASRSSEKKPTKRDCSRK